MADRPLIRIEDLHKTYGDAEVIKGISFNVQEQDVVVIISAARVTGRRNSALNTRRMAETKVPEWLMPIQKTKLTIKTPQ